MPDIEEPCCGSGGGGSARWGEIEGTVNDQTDLIELLDAKQDALPSPVAQAGKVLASNGTDFVLVDGGGESGIYQSLLLLGYIP